MNRSMFGHLALLVVVSLLGAGAVAHAQTSTYTISGDVGVAGTLLSTDGWANTNDLWVSAAFSGGLYARNNNAADSSITRANDAGFSYTIPADTTLLSLQITSRSPAFWQAGLAQGTTQRLGIGYDFGNNDLFYIFDNGTRRSGSGTYTGDVYRTVRMDFDMVAGTADLILDPDGTPVLLLDDQPLTIPSATVQATNALFFRSTAAFSGVSSLTVTAVPEPHSLALLAAAAIGGLSVRRRLEIRKN